MVSADIVLNFYLSSVSNPNMPVIKKLAIATIVIAVLAATALFIYRKQRERKAARIIRLSYEIVQLQRRPTLSELRRRFGEDLRQPNPCIPAGCMYEVEVSNRLLAQLGLAHYTVLKSSFWTRGDMVDLNFLELWTWGGAGAYVNAKYCEGCNGFYSGSCGFSNAKTRSGSVDIDLSSSLDEKRKAYGFNPRCLSNLRGCASVAEILPSIWQVTRTGEVQCTTDNRAPTQ